MYNTSYYSDGPGKLHFRTKDAIFIPMVTMKGGPVTMATDSRIARLAEQQTEKPGAILMQVRVPGAARDFSPRVDFQCRLSYGVRTAQMLSLIHI